MRGGKWGRERGREGGGGRNEGRERGSEGGRERGREGARERGREGGLQGILWFQLSIYTMWYLKFTNIRCCVGLLSPLHVRNYPRLITKKI